MKNKIKILVLLISILLLSDFVALPQVQTENSDTSKPKTDSTVILNSADKDVVPEGETPGDGNQVSLEELVSFERVFWAIIIFIFGMLFIKLTTKILDVFAEKSAKYRITIKGLVPVVRISLWTIIFYIIIAGVFKPPTETLIAVAASLGIAVGFASQDIFKNIFGGIMIIFDRPFQVGDKIEVGSFYGEVVKIGLRSTRIVTADDSLVTIPNGDLMTKSVSNSNTGEANCQVVAEIYLPITVDTEKVRQIAIEAAQVSKYIYLNKPIFVLFFNEVKERRSYYKMRLKAYVLDIRYEFAFKSDMTELVIKELLKQGIVEAKELY